MNGSSQQVDLVRPQTSYLATLIEWQTQSQTASFSLMNKLQPFYQGAHPLSLEVTYLKDVYEGDY